MDPTDNLLPGEICDEEEINYNLEHDIVNEESQEFMRKVVEDWLK